MSIKKTFKPKYLIELIPAWKSKLNYAKMVFNPIEIKLFNRNNWKFMVLCPILELFQYANPVFFEYDLRDCIILVKERKEQNKEKYNGRLEIY